jgi:predicted transcriptional regulator
MSKLDDSILNIEAVSPEGDAEQVANAKQQIKELVLELIGKQGLRLRSQRIVQAKEPLDVCRQQREILAALHKRGIANSQHLAMDVMLDRGLVRLHLKQLQRKGCIVLADVKRGLDGVPRSYYRLTDSGLLSLQGSELRP